MSFADLAVVPLYITQLNPLNITVGKLYGKVELQTCLTPSGVKETTGESN